MKQSYVWTVVVVVLVLSAVFYWYIQLPDEEPTLRERTETTQQLTETVGKITP